MTRLDIAVRLLEGMMPSLAEVVLSPTISLLTLSAVAWRLAGDVISLAVHEDQRSTNRGAAP